MTWDLDAAAQVFVLANLALMVGYLALPVLVVPYLCFRLRTKVAWMVFFVGCVGTHAFSVWQTIDAGTPMHHLQDAGWVAALWHAAQAAGTWAAIIWARADLARADDLLHSLFGGGGRDGT